MSGLQVALATARGFWELDEDATPLVTALDRIGIDASPQVWDDGGVRWADFDLVVLRSVWDYPGRDREFLEWVDTVSGVVALANPSEVVRWNVDKHYLADLGAAGLDVVPTVFVDCDADDRDDRVAEAVGSFDHVVVKPTISAGSRDAGRWTAANRSDAVAHAMSVLGAGKDVMVQPYITPVDGHRETDVICFSGRPSHAVSKAPMLANEGQVSHAPFADELITPAEIDDDHRRLAEAAMAAVAARFGLDDLLYGRVDMLATEGAPMLLEVELTEPSLFLRYDDAAADRAAAAIAARLGCRDRV